MPHNGQQGAGKIGVELAPVGERGLQRQLEEEGSGGLVGGGEGLPVGAVDLAGRSMDGDGEEGLRLAVFVHQEGEAAVIPAAPEEDIRSVADLHPGEHIGHVAVRGTAEGSRATV